MVTYRDLSEDIDPIDFLFEDEKLTVPQSRFTPELTVRFFERTMRMVEMKGLHAKSDHNPYGLFSLPAMLRYEAGHYGKKWLRLEAGPEEINAALPKGTPYQLLYFPIYAFSTPEWKGIPVIEVGPVERRMFGSKIFGNVSSDALLFSKNGRLYFAHAEWKPVKEYFARDREPQYFDDEDIPYTFDLCQLTIEQVEWNDQRILDRISEEVWGNTSSFRSGVQLLVQGTADILEARARQMRFVSDKLEEMSIYYGR